MKTIAWIKKNILQLIIILGFILFGISTCNKGGFSGNTPKADTVFSSHTEYVQSPPVFIPQYVPIQSGSNAPIVLPPQYVQLPADTAALGNMIRELANKYYSQNFYKDSVVLKDTTGKKVGVVTIDDVISENKIKSRTPSYQLTFPVTTNTITITKYAPNKAKFFVGATLEGGKQDVLSEAGIGLIYLSKKNALWNVSAKYNFKGGINYELSRYWKIGK